MAVNQHIWPWDSQPQEAVGVAEGFGLVSLMLPGISNIDLVSGLSLSSTSGTVTPAIRAQGRALAFSANKSSIYVKAPSSITTATEASIVWVGTFDARANDQAKLGGVTHNATNAAPYVFAEIQRGDTVKSNIILSHSCGGTATGLSIGSIDIDVGVAVIVATVKDGEQRIWASVDGVIYSASSSVVGAPVVSANGRVEVGDSLNNRNSSSSCAMQAISNFAWSESQGLELLNNPWQLFAPRTIPIPVSAGGGASTVTSDSSASYSVLASVQKDAAAAYSVIGSVQSSASASYAVTESVQASTSASYSILAATAVTSSTTATYNVIGAVSADSAAAYDVRASIQKAAPAAYSVIGSVASDSAASYAVKAAVQSDTSAAYSVLSASAVTSSSTATYAVIGTVQSDAAASYLVDGDAAPASARMGFEMGGKKRRIYKIRWNGYDYTLDEAALPAFLEQIKEEAEEKVTKKRNARKKPAPVAKVVSAPTAALPDLQARIAAVNKSIGALWSPHADEDEDEELLWLMV